MNIQQVKQLAASGMTRIQIAEATGMSYSYVTTFCNENGITVARKKTVQPKREPKEQDPFFKERDALIADYRNQGMKQSDIAKLLGCSLDVVKNTCRKLKITEKQENVTVEQAIEVINKFGFDYVSGFVNTHSKVLVTCPKCGATFETMYSTIRKSVNGFYHGFTCPGCGEIEREQQKAQREAQKEEERNAKKNIIKQNQLLRESLIINKQLMKLLKTRTCVNCGKEYIIQVTGYDSTAYCSEKCRNRYSWRTKRDKRILRIKSREHDNDITLERVYNKDNGICYLCNGKCNWHDIEDHDGTLIAGDTYPSIDHVKPISKGGTHTWDNVRLAHRRCNMNKRDK